MPTYQYACTECGHAFEQVQSFSDDALTECPQCEGRLRKLFNAVGVVFKGSGFYRTDSRSGSGTDSTATGGAEKKSEGTSTTASKPAATAASASSSSSPSSSSSAPASSTS